MSERAQSHVVGVVLLLGLTAASMGVLAASAGLVLDSTAASADADRAAAALAGIDPTTERDRVAVELADARLHTLDRQVRIGTAVNESGDGNRSAAENGSGEEESAPPDGTRASENRTGAVRWAVTFDADALVYDNGGAGARLLAGAVQRGERGFERDPALGRGNGRIVLSLTTLAGEIERTGSGTVRLRTNTTHSRQTFAGADTVAVEATHTGPWRLAFERAGGTVHTEDIDGDGTTSVVATFPVEGIDLARHRVALRTARNASA